ncbi:putative colanic acid biosynthesis UDP-glucose lipid carrier transferase [Rhodobium orientis]|uniref:Undecaprenyl-phosphate glucose phosphotransferase n=1 Tax=Rhodobium orientis TaxID=34017 RepID=A0A327JWC2_9HYPH|nr:undecaprenyl-phosphate glucose phosphotransferase [Rhodobium orientis]MBB4304781.1 putative colanic acid biosynthesis UDP-glucose lipid carrier transferase [Rhodobium orientis]MBK5948044.1 undecaprenyl-phosphate glucose phosphotransferase [Rhodobium orientis]RAI27478.1 undecaprenyl-phosphate glucose phosphotransferase [Rhodobium orientis]
MSTDQIHPSGMRSPPIDLGPRSAWASRFSRLFGARITVDVYIAVEMLAIFLVGLVIAEIYVRGRLQVDAYFAEYLTPLLVVPVLAAFFQRQHRLNDFAQLRRFSATIGKVALSLILAFVAVIVIGFVAGVANDYSRVWFVSWLLASVVIVTVLRAIAARIFAGLAARGFIQKTVAIIGNAGLARDIAEEIRTSDLGIRVARIFSREEPRPDGNPAGDIGELVQYGQANHLDTIIVAASMMSPSDLERMLTALAVLPTEVQLYLGIGNGHVPIRGVSSLNQLRLLDIQRKPISDWSYLVKVVEDYAVASVALVLAAPIMIGAAIAIKLDSEGPVFFRQRRHGFNHRVINVFKFRTMRVMEDGDEFRQAVRGDARVTRVGAILRKTSIDELPQLFNVLLGDMSVVGPRPHPIALNDQYAGMLARYETRHRVKPGITGWAQINGFRGPTEDPDLMGKRVEYDLDYIENWSLWMDLKILAATPFFGIVHKNAL